MLLKKIVNLYKRSYKSTKAIKVEKEKVNNSSEDIFTKKEKITDIDLKLQNLKKSDFRFRS